MHANFDLTAAGPFAFGRQETQVIQAAALRALQTVRVGDGAFGWIEALHGMAGVVHQPGDKARVPAQAHLSFFIIAEQLFKQAVDARIADGQI